MSEVVESQEPVTEPSGVPAEPVSPEAVVAESEPAVTPRKGPPATVPYDALKDARMQLKRERQLLREERKMREELEKQRGPSGSIDPASLPEDPVARAQKIVEFGTAGIERKVNTLATQIARQAEESDRKTFWDNQDLEQGLAEQVEARYQMMVRQAQAMGQQPMFNRQDIYDYELGRTTRTKSKLNREVATEVKTSQAAVKKAATSVAGATPVAPKPSNEKRPDEMTLAELLESYGDVQF